jgi:hypothetical protein
MPQLYQVANSYIRPNVATYLNNLQKAVKASKLSILRSDGGACPAFPTLPSLHNCQTRRNLLTAPPIMHDPPPLPTPQACPRRRTPRASR